MSETIRYSPWAEPGAAAVTFLPKMTEHPEPGGVNWITRKSSPRGEVGVKPPPEAAVKALGAIDVRNRDDDDLEFHVHPPRVRGLDCSVAHMNLRLLGPRRGQTKSGGVG